MEDTGTLLSDLIGQAGVLVKSRVSWPRLGQKLTPEDLGLPATDNRKSIVLGHKKLLGSGAETMETFRTCESRLNALVNDSTRPFMGIGHFVPNGQLDAFNEAFRTLRRAWQSAVNAWLPTYPALREAALAEWHEYAISKGLPDADLFMARIREALPQPNELAFKFNYGLTFFRIEAPADLQLAGFDGVEEHMSVHRARQAAATEARDHIMTQANAFIDDYTATLRQGVCQLANDMLRAIHNSKTGVHQKTLNRLDRMWDYFNRMNFHGDAELGQLLEQARSEILSRSAGEYRDSDAFKSELTGKLTELKDKAASLARQDAAQVRRRFMETGRRKFNI
jgi:hypothetical protein